MRRRDLIVLLGGTAVAWPIASHSQQRKKIPRIGVLWHAANAEEEDVYLSVLTKAFNDRGYVDGKSVQLEHRLPDEDAGLAPMFFNQRVLVGVSAEMVPHRLLLFYGQDFPDFFRRAAGYVDRILTGAKPADPPVQQPTQFKLVINLRIAKALGLRIP